MRVLSSLKTRPLGASHWASCALTCSACSREWQQASHFVGVSHQNRGAHYRRTSVDAGRTAVTNFRGFLQAHPEPRLHQQRADHPRPAENPPRSARTRRSRSPRPSATFRTISLAGNDPSASSHRGWSMLSNAADKSASRRFHARWARGPLSVRKRDLIASGAATAGAKPVGTGLEPSLPLELQARYGPAPDDSDPSPRGYRADAVFRWPSECTRAEPARAPTTTANHAPAPQCSPSPRATGQPPHQSRPSTPSIALSHLSHTDQHIRPGTQHQFLQRPDRGPVLFPRRLKDPAPQPRYIFLMDAPIHDAPIKNALRSVHLYGVQLALPVRKALGLGISKAHLPTSAPFRAQPPPADIRPVPMIVAQERRHHDHKSRCLSAIGIGFLASFPPRDSASHDRPTGPKAGPDGVSTFHAHEIRPGRAPSIPRDQRCSHDRPVASGRRLPPLPAARSYHPGSRPVFPGFK